MNSPLYSFVGPALLLLVAICINVGVVQAVSADPPRNILFIAVDDLRNWVGYGGDYAGTIHTPNIDALAAVSTRYLNAYTTVPQCVGSRTSVMMGMSPATHHLTTALWGVEPSYLAIYDNPAIVSLPQVMSQNGYYTAVTGKVFNNSLPDRWDESGPISNPTVNIWDPGPDNTYLTAEVSPSNEVHPDQEVANWAVNFINTYPEGNEPFFLATGFYLPHLPWRIPQWAYDLYPLEEVVVSTPIPGDLEDEPTMAVKLANAQKYNGMPQYELIETAGKAAEYTRAYLAGISHTDAMIGELLAALAASPHANNTDIILWSDHGYHLGEKFHWAKNTFWEQSTKIPLLVSSPGNGNYPVSDVTAAVSLLDLAPTVLDLAGIAPYAQFEGVPLRNGANHGSVQIYFNKGRATVTQAGRKTIDYDLETAQGAIDQAAYNLLSDKGEQYNVWAPPGC